MLVNIRCGVFETNSSSTHSVTYRRKNANKVSKLITDEHNNVLCNLGAYGWGPDTLYSPEEKLDYIVTMIFVSRLDQGIPGKLKDYKQFEDFIMLENEIKTLGYDGLICETIGKPVEFYLDHQSMYYTDEKGICYKKFFDDWEIPDLETYLFGDTAVIISNDNGY